MAATITTWLGATTITTSGELIPTTGTALDIMSGINNIQTTLTDMQTKLDTLVGTAAIPVVSPTSDLGSGAIDTTKAVPTTK